MHIVFCWPLGAVSWHCSNPGVCRSCKPSCAHACIAYPICQKLNNLEEEHMLELTGQLSCRISVQCIGMGAMHLHDMMSSTRLCPLELTPCMLISLIAVWHSFADICLYKGQHCIDRPISYLPSLSIHTFFIHLGFVYTRKHIQQERKPATSWWQPFT